MIPKRSVIGRVRDLIGVEGQTGFVEFRPVVYRRGAPFVVPGITDNTTTEFLVGEVIVPFYDNPTEDADGDGDLDANDHGAFHLDLPVTDSLNTTPTNFAWWAVVKSTAGTKLWSFYFNLPEDEYGPLDLSNAVPADTGGGTDTSDNGNASRGSDGVLVRNGIRMSDVWIRSSGDPIPENLPPNTLVVTV